MNVSAKVRESRLRRMAERRGLVLKKSRRRSPRAWDYGPYWLFDADRDTLIFPDEHGASLQDIESYLNSDH